VAELMQFGYPPPKCAAALREGGGEVPAALALLFRQLAGKAGPASRLDWLDYIIK
jgi:hypothetical protein